jgi:hypothetical protein
MINLLKFLIFGYIHKWKIYKETKIQDMNTGCKGIQYDLQCEKCGSIKFKASI